MKYHLTHNCSILIISVTMQCYAMYVYVTEYMCRNIHRQEHI